MNDPGKSTLKLNSYKRRSKYTGPGQPSNKSEGVDGSLPCPPSSTLHRTASKAHLIAASIAAGHLRKFHPRMAVLDSSLPALAADCSSIPISFAAHPTWRVLPERQFEAR
jgi:hypothetical protein